MESRLVPLQEVLSESGLSSKQWAVLVDAGLMSGAVRIPGSMQYGVHGAGCDRLEALVRTRASLDGRYTISNLAFESAARGLDVPASLVKAELELRLIHQFGFIKRTLQRACGLSADTSEVTRSQIYKAADKLSMRLTKKMRRGRFLSQQFLKLFLGIFLRMLYLNDEVVDSSRNVREYFLPFVRVEHPKLGILGMSLGQAQGIATQIVFLISASRDVLTLDPDRNKMLRSISKIPDETFWQLFRAWPSVCKIYWTNYERAARSVPIPHFDTAARNDFELMILGVLVSAHDREKSEGAVVYRNILAGSMDSLSELLEKTCVAIEQTIEAQRLIQKLLGDKK